jgi:Flp pilus assembly protein TadG
MPSDAPPSRLSRTEDGSASLEFIVAGLVLLVPIVYLVVVLFQVQAAVLAAEGGARQAARLFVDAADVDSATAQASTAVEFALADQGIDPTTVDVSITCGDGGPGDCLDPGDLVTVTVRLDVALPLAPPVLGLDDLAVVPIEASAVNAVSEFHAGTRS